MKMVTRIALSNAKYHKSKNILTGVAIFLTTLLLFLIPTVGKNMIDGQYAVVNAVYPSWHALYRNVTQEDVKRLSVHHNIARYGLRSDAGKMVTSGANVSLLYMDEEGFSLYNMELVRGEQPKAENEIVVSEGILQELGQAGEIGDTITVPFQIYRDGGLDFTQEDTFVISGFVADPEVSEDVSREERSYSAFVSKEFLEKQIPGEQIVYRFLFQVVGNERSTTHGVEEVIHAVANQFGIQEGNIGINTSYLGANYVDPVMVPFLILIMCIVVFAGIITIYSIYYVSMSERIQEFGKIKAIGATKHQMHQIVLREGFLIALAAIPLGLIIGSIVSRVIFLTILELLQDSNFMIRTMKQLLSERQFGLYHWWIYAIAIFVTLLTVFLSLQRPMKIAGKVSEVEAMRYRSEQAGKKGRKTRKGYLNISISRLAKVYLAGNKKKSLITICSMGMTGIFLMMVATVLSCATPVESANNSILGQYRILPIVEHGNKEHPEWEWSSIQQNNPLTEEFRERIEQIDGVHSVESFAEIHVTLDDFENQRESILGVPESYKEVLEKGIIQGEATYEDLLEGDKVIIDKNILYWNPDIQVGDMLSVTIEDGFSTYQKEVEVLAIGDYPIGFSSYSYLMMAKAGAETLGSHNLNYSYNVFADKDYDEKLESRLKEMAGESGLLQVETWQAYYEQWKSAMELTSGASYAFLGILSAICIMNMVNTMINSVHIRKKNLE